MQCIVLSNQKISAIKRFDVDVAIIRMKKEDIGVTFGDDFFLIMILPGDWSEEDGEIPVWA